MDASESPAAHNSALPRPLARRLRDLYRSAGWPSHDPIEIELLACGLIERVQTPGSSETLRVTDAGLAVLAQSLRRNRAAFDAHQSLVERVALEMQRSGRISWCTLRLRVHVDDAWTIACPDVYSVRRTTLEAYLAPQVHEIKVRRADLLADLKRPAKRGAYLQMAGSCSYVLAEGIAEPEEIPLECGVLLARVDKHGAHGPLECLRPAPQHAHQMSFAVWMALARATPYPAAESTQGQLGGAVAD